MNNKDLFDAIHNIDENYITGAWENTDADRPIVIRPEKRSVMKTVRRVMLGVGGTAAAAVVGFAVFIGVRSIQGISSNSGYSYNKIEPLGSHYAAEMSLAPGDSIVQDGVRGYLQSSIDKYRAEHPELDAPDALFFPEKVDFYYFNDVPVRAELLTDSTIEWLCEYYNMTDEEKAKEDIGFLNDLLLADPYHRIRYGDLGWLRENITDSDLPVIEKYCSDIANFGSADPTGVPMPDIYYFQDAVEERPYTRKMLEQSYDSQSARYLDWYCRLCEADQEALSGYVYNCIDRNPGEPVEFDETLYYKGTSVKSAEIDYDTALYITWYNGLTDELKEKVGFVPDTLLSVMESDIVRFGDLGFFRDKYTEEELKYFEKYCALPLAFSSMPPQPDVYYYNDVPYYINQLQNEDTRKWLEWFCWLDDGLQEKMSGYIPSEISGEYVACTSERPQKIAFGDLTLNVWALENESVKFLDWYNSLSDELVSKVDYYPKELDLIKNGFYYFSKAVSLPFPLVGPDGNELYYVDFYRFTIVKPDKEPQDQLDLSFVDIGDEMIVRGFTYLCAPDTGNFKRYNVGDEINGLTLTDANARFVRLDTDSGISPVLQYIGGEATFSGSITVDAKLVKKDGADDRYFCAISGLPVIDVDELARENSGSIVPKPHYADEFANDPNALLDQQSSRYLGYILGQSKELDEAAQNGGIVKGIEITDINLFWQDFYEDQERYIVTAKLK